MCKGRVESAAGHRSDRVQSSLAHCCWCCHDQRQCRRHFYCDCDCECACACACHCHHHNHPHHHHSHLLLTRLVRTQHSSLSLTCTLYADPATGPPKPRCHSCTETARSLLAFALLLCAAPVPFSDTFAALERGSPSAFGAGVSLRFLVDTGGSLQVSSKPGHALR
eukprot:3219879-Rhodomonas_salina.1